MENTQTNYVHFSCKLSVRNGLTTDAMKWTFNGINAHEMEILNVNMNIKFNLVSKQRNPINF